MIKCVFMIAALSLVSPASAGGMDSMTIANNLGTMLAAEDACGLSFDQTAIESYIEKNVKAADMDFPSTLQLMTSGAEAQLHDLSNSAKTAHCVQIKRSAKANGFIK